MYIGLCLFVAIVGFLVFNFAKNEKIMELGKAMMWCGLLSFLISAQPLVTIFGGKLK